MKQKLLEALKTKFIGVDTQILDRIATKKAEGITDQNQITSIADGISFQDVLQSYGDSRAGDASKTAVSNYEKKYNLKEGKAAAADNPDPMQNNDPKTDDVPQWAKVLIDQNKTLNEKIASIEGAKAEEQRLTMIQAKAREYGIPESQAMRYYIPEDADLDEYFKDVKQEYSNLGFKDVQAPESPEAGIKKENESIAASINAGTKEIVEQSKK